MQAQALVRGLGCYSSRTTSDWCGVHRKKSVSQQVFSLSASYAVNLLPWYSLCTIFNTKALLVSRHDQPGFLTILLSARLETEESRGESYISDRPCNASGQAKQLFVSPKRAIGLVESSSRSVGSLCQHRACLRLGGNNHAPPSGSHTILFSQLHAALSAAWQLLQLQQTRAVAASATKKMQPQPKHSCAGRPLFYSQNCNASSRNSQQAITTSLPLLQTIGTCAFAMLQMS